MGELTLRQKGKEKLDPIMLGWDFCQKNFGRKRKTSAEKKERRPNWIFLRGVLLKSCLLARGGEVLKKVGSCLPRRDRDGKGARQGSRINCFLRFSLREGRQKTAVVRKEIRSFQWAISGGNGAYLLYHDYRGGIANGEQFETSRDAFLEEKEWFKKKGGKTRLTQEREECRCVERMLCGVIKVALCTCGRGLSCKTLKFIL